MDDTERNLVVEFGKKKKGHSMLNQHIVGKCITAKLWLFHVIGQYLYQSE